MKDLIRTNNPALISYVEALLKQLDIHYFVADQAISSAEGSIGMFPQRILVSPEHLAKAPPAGKGDDIRTKANTASDKRDFMERRSPQDGRPDASPCKEAVQAVTRETCNLARMVAEWQASRNSEID